MSSTTSKTDRIPNRAPKGGAIGLVNGLFYKGGTFLPMVAEVIEVKPAPLAGSSRQVAWAARLRTQALANIPDEIDARLLFLTSPIRAEVAANRKAVRTLLIARQRLMTERPASVVIGRRAGLMA